MPLLKECAVLERSLLTQSAGHHLAVTYAQGFSLPQEI
jgi:hypothetical protein